MWQPYQPSSPVVLTFDHPPTDAELQVPQPWRNPFSPVRLRKETDVWTIYIPRCIWIVALFWLLMHVGVVAVLVRGWSQRDVIGVAATVSLFATALCGLGWAVDRQIVRLGPLVVYRRNRNELLIEGRPEPLSTNEVTEIVELTLPDHAWRVGGDGDGTALYLVVHRRDAIYTAERLYHGQRSGKATWDAGPQLAKALQVRYRRIELEHRDPVLSNFPNTKPPKKLDIAKRK